MVSKAFEKELMGLSPYELTLVVRRWMKLKDSRLELLFAWKTPEDMKHIPEEFYEHECVSVKLG